jgi:uncharacterized protein (TIGR00730 family)
MLQNSITRMVCVFCGAGGKMDDFYQNQAFILGQTLASNGFSLLTGGANVGMMKQVVDGHAQTNPNGLRYGALPYIFKEFNINHPLIPIDNMHWPLDVHERLKIFYDLSDILVVLPGGFGTLNELMDCLVHSQFGLIKKRIFLLNIKNFWDNLLAQFKLMVDEFAVPQKHVDHLVVVKSLDELTEKLKSTKVIELEQGIESERWAR